MSPEEQPSSREIRNMLLGEAALLSGGINSGMGSIGLSHESNMTAGAVAFVTGLGLAGVGVRTIGNAFNSTHQANPNSMNTNDTTSTS